MHEGIKNLPWDSVAYDAYDFLEGWKGKPNDISQLKEQWENKEGELFDEFVEFLISK